MRVIELPSFARTSWTRLVSFACKAFVTGGIFWFAGLFIPQFENGFRIAASLGLLVGVIALSKSVNAWYGDLGENRVTRALKALDDRYIVIRNWVPLRNWKRRGDIDAILIGPFGIAAFEVKTYSVPTKCDGDEWFVERSSGNWLQIKSPSKQLRRNAALVSRACGFQVFPVLVFNERADLTLSHPSCQIMRPSELPMWIQSLPDRGFISDAILAQFEDLREINRSPVAA